MKKERFKISAVLKKLLPLSSFFILLSCSQKTPFEKSSLSIKAYLSDSLKNSSISYKEFSKFDTIKKFDSLNYQLRNFRDTITEIKQKIYDLKRQKQSFDTMAKLAMLSGNNIYLNQVAIANENYRRATKNFNQVLDYLYDDSIKTQKLINDPTISSQIIGYKLFCKYEVNSSMHQNYFTLNPKFKIISTN